MRDALASESKLPRQKPLSDLHTVRDGVLETEVSGLASQFPTEVLETVSLASQFPSLKKLRPLGSFPSSRSSPALRSISAVVVTEGQRELGMYS